MHRGVLLSVTGLSLVIPSSNRKLGANISQFLRLHLELLQVQQVSLLLQVRYSYMFTGFQKIRILQYIQTRTDLLTLIILSKGHQHLFLNSNFLL
ncbi:hypothetical protein GDO78_008756 [Eleutherodactylus coqui]|uniref:Uncharacterized protein n=1 Tax=Eleutherodactylus coqui TaxID=57060 RepID=A0A8J6FCN7_ELECQ|nr:hypothetical protein GDO78_008756 [Eleutherodactylus coqui]